MPDEQPSQASTLAANLELCAAMEDIAGKLRDAQQATERARAISPVPAACPDTRFVVLAALEGRKSGRVTVGDSRLPAVMVLEVLRLHGIEEARLQWPQLSGGELSVLEQLAADLAEESADA